MGLWTVHEYVTADGGVPFDDWYEAQPEEVQGQFDSTMFILCAQPDWEVPNARFKVLTKKHAGLGEVRFHIMTPGEKRPHRRRFRPVGIWPPTTDLNFILILGCEKPSRTTYIPNGAFDLALKLRAEFLDGKGTTRERV